MFNLGSGEMFVVGVIAILLFGSRLPSVARSLGKSFTEFKRGMQGLEDEMRDVMNTEPAGHLEYHDHTPPSTPSFKPPEAVKQD